MRASRVNAVLAGLLLASACARAGCSGDPSSDAPADAGRTDARFDAPWSKDVSPADVPLESAAEDSGIGKPTDAPVTDVGAPGYEWLFDDAWTPLVTQPKCDVRVGDVTKLKWPAFVWKPCGAGCQQAEVVTGPNAVWKGARRTGSGSRTTQGVLTIYLAAGVRLPPGAGWVAALEVPSWKPASVVNTYGDDCILTFSGQHTSVFLVLAGTDFVALGHAAKPGATFASPLHSHGSVYFDMTSGWGHIAADSVVGVSSDVKSTVFTNVHTSPGPLEDPQGAGSAGLWRDWSGPTARVFVWTKQGGARVLVGTNYHVVQHATTDDRLVWVGATGAIPNETFKSAQLYWSELKVDPDQLVPKLGPKLPIKYSPDPVFAAGKWVTMLGIDVSGVLVADLDTNTVWTIPTPAGHFRTPLGISESTLVVADATPGFGQPTQYFDQLVQYDLSKISSFAQKVP